MGIRGDKRPDVHGTGCEMLDSSVGVDAAGGGGGGWFISMMFCLVLRPRLLWRRSSHIVVRFIT